MDKRKKNIMPLKIQLFAVFLHGFNTNHTWNHSP